MSRKEVGIRNAQEEQRKLRKSFFIQLESQKEDLYSIYFSFLQICTQKQQEQVYKKWMQFPQKNEAYVLSIQKEETKKKLTQLYQKSGWQECKTKNLKWKEVEVEKDLIRIVMYEGSSNSPLEVLQANRYSECVIIHNVGSDQYEIQKLSLQQTEKFQSQEQALIERSNSSNLVDQQLFQNDLQNNSDEVIKDNSNLNTNKTKLEEQEILILNLKQVNEKNEQLIKDLNNQLYETQKHLENTADNLKEIQEYKQINLRLRADLDQSKTAYNQERQLNQVLNDKLEKIEKELEIEKSKNILSEQNNSQIHEKRMELHNTNLKLINDMKELSIEHEKIKTNLEKYEKKYYKKKEKFQKLKEKFNQQKENMNSNEQKFRQDINYIQTTFEQQIKDQKSQIEKLQQSLSACEKNKQKYEQKYNELKTYQTQNEFIYESKINKTLNFEDTPLGSNRDSSILQHRNQFKNIELSFKQSNFDNQFDYGINYNTDYYLDSSKQSQNKLSVQGKNSMNKDQSQKADIFTLQSSLKESKISLQKESNQDSIIMQTLEKQKDFIQNCQSNKKQNNYLECLDSCEKQLKFEPQKFDSLSQIQSNSNLESNENQDCLSSVSQLSEGEQESKEQSYSANSLSSQQEKENKDNKKQRQFKHKPKNRLNKQQKIIKLQNPSKVLDNKNNKQKYLIQKKKNEKLLNKQLNSSLITKPHMKESIQEQIEKKQYLTNRQQLFQTRCYENNNNNQNINNLSKRSLIQINKNHLKREITKQQK
ncbi:hypothetical protein ABPG74_019584 [Tetrahymena malaccensis]